MNCALKSTAASFVFPLAAKEERSIQKLDPNGKYLGNFNSGEESVSSASTACLTVVVY